MTCVPVDGVCVGGGGIVVEVINLSKIYRQDVKKNVMIATWVERM